MRLQLTVANRLGCERMSIADSVKRLSDHLGWIFVKEPWQWNGTTKRKTRGIGWTDGLSVNMSELPMSTDRQCKHPQSSLEAIKLMTNTLPN